MINIKHILTRLSEKKPIFHSEADFQHSLAWEIHLSYPKANIRLETNPYVDRQRAHIDILIKTGDERYAIELKYKTRKLDIESNGESFHLLNQSAQDIGRYDFIKDIVRLEKFVNENVNAKGFTIFLTNDAGYWKKTINGETVDKAFRIYEDRILEGSLSWNKRASAGTKKGREKDLQLRSNYRLKWADYSELEDSNKGRFRYLLLEV